MIEVVGHRRVLGQWAGTLRRRAILLGIAAVVLVILDRACLARVETNAWGVEQRRFGFNTGIVERAYGPGLLSLVGRPRTASSTPQHPDVRRLRGERRRHPALFDRATR